MAHPDHQELHEALTSPEYARDQILSSFDVLASTIGKPLVITIFLAENRRPITFGHIAGRLNALQRDEPRAHIFPPHNTTVKSYCDSSFSKGGLVASRKGPAKYKGREATYYSPTDKCIEYGAAVSGVLIKVQRNHPHIAFNEVFGTDRAGGGSTEALPRLRVLARLIDNPNDFVSTKLLIETDPTIKYDTIEALTKMDVLEHTMQSDKTRRRFAIRQPRHGTDRKRSSPEAIMLHEAAMSLLGMGELTVTTDDLLEHVQVLFGDVDLEKVWFRLRDARPTYLTPLREPSFSKGADKAAIRIAPIYRAFIAELTEELKSIIKSSTARRDARDYAQYILTQPHIVAALMHIAYGAPDTAPEQGIPAPHYEGWRTDKHLPEKWRPSFLPRESNIDMAAVALAASKLKPWRGPRLISNKEQSQILEANAIIFESGLPKLNSIQQYENPEW